MEFKRFGKFVSVFWWGEADGPVVGSTATRSPMSDVPMTDRAESTFVNVSEEAVGSVAVSAGQSTCTGGKVVKAADLLNKMNIDAIEEKGAEQGQNQVSKPAQLLLVLLRN